MTFGLATVSIAVRKPMKSERVSDDGNAVTGVVLNRVVDDVGGAP